MPLLIAALLGLSAALIVLYPLLGVDLTLRPAAAPSDVSEAAEREQAAKVALRELEFDYRLGNIEAGDYTSLRDRYERRALAALRARAVEATSHEQELDALIERELAALRAEEGQPARRAARPAANGTTTQGETPAAATGQASHRSAPQSTPRTQGVRARRQRGGTHG